MERTLLSFITAGCSILVCLFVFASAGDAATNGAAFFGLQDAVQELPASVTAQLHENAKHYAADDLPDAPKRRACLFTPLRLQVVRENVDRYAWAAQARDAAVVKAEAILARPVEQFLDTMPSPNMIRDMSGSRGNTRCPHCGKTMKRFRCADIIARPWVATCPLCGKDGGAGRLQAYVASGRDEKGWFREGRADASLLPPGKEARAAAVQAMRNYAYRYWYRYRDILKALREAYVLTGEPRYARYALNTMVRFADVYPYFRRNDTRGDTHPGSMIQNGHESYFMKDFALTYDAVFRFAVAPEVQDFVNTYRTAYGERRFQDGNEIKHYIEGRTFGLIAGDRTGSKRFMRRILNLNDGRGWVVPNIIAGIFDGTSLGQAYREEAEKFKFSFLPDGSNTEGALGYDTGGFRSITESYRDVIRFLPYKRYQVWQRKDVLAAYELYFDMYCLDRYYPHYGDSHYMAHAYPIFNGGSTCSLPDIAEVNRRRARDYLLLFKATGHPRFARIARYLNNGSVKGLHLTVYDKDPEAIQAEVAAAERQAFTPLVRSFEAPHLGMMMLKSGEGKDRRAVWMRPNDKDMVKIGGNHWHADSMNIGLFAFGLDLLPDTGKFNLKNQVFGHNTVSLQSAPLPEETMGARPRTNHFPILARTDFMGKVDDIQVARARGVKDPGSYRTLFLVDVSEDSFYIVDGFCVSTSQPAEFATYAYHTQQGPIRSSLAFEAEGKVWPGTTRWQGRWLPPMYTARPASGKGPWWVETSIQDTYGYLDEPSDVKVRLTFLHRSERVWHAFFQPPKGFPGTPERIPYFFVSRPPPPSGLPRWFSAVIEPYRKQRVVRSSQVVKTTHHGDIIEVVESGGRTLLFFISDGREEMTTTDDVVFRGRAGVLVTSPDGQTTALTFEKAAYLKF